MIRELLYQVYIFIVSFVSKVYTTITKLYAYSRSSILLLYAYSRSSILLLYAYSRSSILFIISRIVSGYEYSKIKIVNSYRYVKTSSIQLKNIFIVKTFDLWRILVITSRRIVFKVLSSIRYIGSQIRYSIVNARQLIKYYYNSSKQKIITSVLYTIAVITSIYRYIKLTGVVSSTIAKNTLQLVRQKIVEIIESDKSVSKKYYTLLVSYIDSISYTLLKISYFAYKNKSYTEPLYTQSGTISPELQTWLNQSNRGETAEQYLARSVLFIFIITIIGIISGGIIGALLAPQILAIEVNLINIPPVIYNFFNSYGVILLSIVMAIFIGLLSSISVLAVTYIIAWYRARETRRQININYNDAISHMYSLVEGGSDTTRLIYQMANTEETTGKVAVEFQKIIQIIEYEQENVTSALRIQSNRTPSERMSNLLSDLQTIQETGTSAEEILKSKHNEVLVEKDTQAENNKELIELLNEVMLTVGLLPIFLMILMMVQAIQGSLPAQTLLLLSYGSPYIIFILFSVLLGLLLQDESTSEKTIDINRQFYEPHAHIYKIPSVLENKLQSEKRNINHITDPQTNKILDKLYRQKYRKENIIRPLFDIRNRPLATFPYTILLTLVYYSIVLVFIGVPSLEIFTNNPLTSYLFYILFPKTILLTPAIIIHRRKQKRINKIKQKIPTILDTTINGIKTGKSIEESLRDVKTSKNNSIINILLNPVYEIFDMNTSDKSKIQKTIDMTWNDIQWKNDRIYALKKMANNFEVPRMTRTMKIITDSAQYTSNLVPVLNIEKINIEKDLEVENIISSAGIMAGVILVLVAVLNAGILSILDRLFIQLLKDAATGGGEAAAQASGQSSQFGLNQKVFGVFRSRFAHMSAGMGFTFGWLAGFLYKQSILSATAYGLVIEYIALLGYMLVVTI